MSDIKASDLLTALRTKHADAAVVREVVIDDPIDEGYRFRERIDRYQAMSESEQDHYGHWVRREFDNAARRGVTIPDRIPEGWSLRTSVPQRRIDALIIGSTGRTAVEIKVSRADFKRDTDEKRRAWQSVTNRFLYLVPKGLVTPDEVAEGCGLWEFDPDVAGPFRWQHGITLIKRAKINKAPDPLPFQVMRALAYRVSNYERQAE